MKRIIEAEYPIGFRKTESAQLGGYLKNHQSVALVGMKRVGISNFLRFFLNHEKVAQTYIGGTGVPIFVQIDLNDLIERNLSAFWALFLTRVVDTVQRSNIPESQKRQCRHLFVQSVQLKDHFFTLESVRKCLEMLVAGGYSPTLFLIRFDRITEAVTPEFFSNLVGLRDAVKGRMSYVFTSYRPLEDLSPEVFTRQLVSVFTRQMYLPPATDADMDSIITTLEQEYHASFDVSTRKALLAVSGGYVQYLQLAILRLKEEKSIPKETEQLVALLSSDEQIAFQSEELFESLTKKEKEILLQVKQGNTVSKDERKDAQYLWNTGMLADVKGKAHVFSPLFDAYVGNISAVGHEIKEFTKKEHLLFTYLKDHAEELCEREAIIEAVWPEHQELGVSDWAIDRLVARLRSKLKAHSSPYSILTIVTRGYKLTKS
jgi:hypothetical protein